MTEACFFYGHEKKTGSVTNNSDLKLSQYICYQFPYIHTLIVSTHYNKHFFSYSPIFCCKRGCTITLKLSNSPFMVVSTTTNCTTTRDKTVLGKKIFFFNQTKSSTKFVFCTYFLFTCETIYSSSLCFTQLTLYTFKKTNFISRLFLPIPNYNGEVLHKNGASKQTISYEKLSIMLIS